MGVEVVRQIDSRGQAARISALTDDNALRVGVENPESFVPRISEDLRQGGEVFRAGYSLADEVDAAVEGESIVEAGAEYLDCGSILVIPSAL